MIQWIGRLLPNLMIWVLFLGPSWWKERTNSYKLSADLHVLWHVHMHTLNRCFGCADVYLHVPAERTKVNVECLPLPFPLYILKQSVWSSLLASLADQWGLRSSCSHPASRWSYRWAPPHLAFTWALGVWIKVLMVVKQALHKLSHLRGPNTVLHVRV